MLRVWKIDLLEVAYLMMQQNSSENVNIKWVILNTCLEPVEPNNYSNLMVFTPNNIKNEQLLVIINL